MLYRVIFFLLFPVFCLFSSVSASEDTKQRIAIINYGPHSSLKDTIDGIIDGLEDHGFKDQDNVVITVDNVNFDTNLIPQMVSKAKASKPNLIIAMTTPVAQMAKNMIKGIPIIYTAVTDPVEAGLLTELRKVNSNVTGASDKQSAKYVLSMAKQLLPKSDMFGMLYSTAEANDEALRKMLLSEAPKHNLSLMAVAVDQMRDVPMRMQQLNRFADFIYVGTSGPIQPALPTISSIANKMNIPVINADPAAVKKHQVLASFGVRYYRIGLQTANMVSRILQGEDISTIQPQEPSYKEHHAFVSKKQMAKFNVTLPSDLTNITIVE